MLISQFQGRTRRQEKKLIAEARADEAKTILGWICNFITLSVALPENKFVAWRKSIFDVLEAGCTSFKELEIIIGRLIHLGIPLPPIHHFMSRIRGLLRRAKNRRIIKLNDTVIKDLKLMLFFLEEAARVDDMNLLVYRKPTKIYRSDSCSDGMEDIALMASPGSFTSPLS